MNIASSADATVSGSSLPVSPWTVFWIASSAVLLVALDSTMLFSIFSTLRASFPEASAADMSWVLNAYTIVYAAMLIPAGGLAQAHGAKRVFLLGALVFIAASAGCGFAPNVATLVGARSVQAIGAAMLTPASLSLVLAAFPRSRHALVVNMWGAVGGFAAALGPSLGSSLAHTMGWSWAFFINLPIGLCASWLGLRWLAPSKPQDPRRKVDLVGMALLIVAVGLLALAIVEADSPVWTHAELAAAATASAATWAGFIVWALIAREPLVNLALFRDRTFSAVTLATLTFGIAFSMTFFAFFFYMTQIWHYSEARAGLAIAPGPLTVVPVAILTGRLAQRFGHRPFLVAGALIYAGSALWLLLMPGLEPDYLRRWLPGLFMSGAGVGLVLPTLSGAAVSKLAADRYSIGTAVNQASRQIGGSVGVAITVMWLGHHVARREDFTAVYGGIVGLALLTAALCALVDTRRRVG